SYVKSHFLLAAKLINSEPKAAITSLLAVTTFFPSLFAAVIFVSYTHLTLPMKLKAATFEAFSTLVLAGTLL
ncbi:hypothetical protein, partial [Lactobacillus crispatus]|uniref:hypothetical protein n=1 Tax=Lactobacillus crispatus TaxID=47770 RepID=UPI00197B37EF